MNMLIVALVAIIIVAVLLSLRPRGPRVTQIDRTREIDEDDDA